MPKSQDPPDDGKEESLRRHGELPGRVAAEPTGQARPAVTQARVNVQEADRAGAAVEVLVGASEGQVDAVCTEVVLSEPDLLSHELTHLRHLTPSIFVV